MIIRQIDLRQLEEFRHYREFAQMECASLPGLYRWVRSFLFEFDNDGDFGLDCFFTFFQERLAQLGSLGPAATEVFSSASLGDANWKKYSHTRFSKELADQLEIDLLSDTRSSDLVERVANSVARYFFSRGDSSAEVLVTNDRWTPWLTGDFDSTLLLRQKEPSRLWMSIVREYDAPTDSMLAQLRFSTN